MGERRSVLAVLTLVLATAVSGAAPAVAATGQGDTSSLRAAARGSGVRIGTAVDMSTLADDAPYRAAVAREFDTVTAENEMKWQVVEPERGRYDWAAADRLVDFARANGQAVRGHTLVWHNQNPSWLTEDAFTPAELRRILRDHIHTEVRHFKGRIWHWDVVNEAINEDGTLRDSIWLRALGPGYIADAFRWAHEADPKAKLYLNDYNNEGVNAKSDAYYALVKRLRAEGVPVHGYGMQGHLAVQYGFPDTVAENVRRFDVLGVQTAFTEVDVRMILPADPVKVQAQAQGFSSLLQACLLARHCVSYTLWGFTDRYSWVPGWFDGEGSATPFDEELRPKPAYQALRNTFLLGRR
ncbi:endo-1,4-beta-xylanase [Actinoplanes sp. NEAU-A12]|uniref:Beta-xylanase n=1 Tax=Actinoplanes sandaracinus TaxID=3045177 RepID=A0ABT6WLG6_9ACTN|nr:endo-1,4-beta-xylanase [Actinoplanes sandaracinus]MDI6100577.1 endo-1,4-beta-xylanase [Actinoplanes sandaracinus]